MAEGQNIWWGVVAIEGHLKKGSVAGPVIQANGRLIFEEDWRPALLCFSEPGSAPSLMTVLMFTSSVMDTICTPWFE